MSNPRFFLTLSIDGRYEGQIVLETFSDLCPKASKLFHFVCVGESEAGLRMHTKESRIHNVVRGQMIRGSLSPESKVEGESRFATGSSFMDEAGFKLKNNSKGLLSLDGFSDNGTLLFSINTLPLPYLDGQRCIFGKVIEGQGIVTAIEHVPTEQDLSPLCEVLVTDTGRMSESDIGTSLEANAPDLESLQRESLIEGSKLKAGNGLLTKIPDTELNGFVPFIDNTELIPLTTDDEWLYMPSPVRNTSAKTKIEQIPSDKTTETRKPSPARNSKPMAPSKAPQLQGKALQTPTKKQSPEAQPKPLRKSSPNPSATPVSQKMQPVRRSSPYFPEISDETPSNLRTSVSAFPARKAESASRPGQASDKKVQRSSSVPKRSAPKAPAKKLPERRLSDSSLNTKGTASVVRGFVKESKVQAGFSSGRRMSRWPTSNIQQGFISKEDAGKLPSANAGVAPEKILEEVAHDGDSNLPDVVLKENPLDVSKKEPYEEGSLADVEDFSAVLTADSDSVLTADSSALPEGDNSEAREKEEPIADSAGVPAGQNEESTGENIGDEGAESLVAGTEGREDGAKEETTDNDTGNVATADTVPDEQSAVNVLQGEGSFIEGEGAETGKKEEVTVLSWQRLQKPYERRGFVLDDKNVGKHTPQTFEKSENVIEGLGMKEKELYGDLVSVVKTQIKDWRQEDSAIERIGLDALKTRPDNALQQVEAPSKQRAEIPAQVNAQIQALPEIVGLSPAKATEAATEVEGIAQSDLQGRRYSEDDTNLQKEVDTIEVRDLSIRQVVGKSEVAVDSMARKSVSLEVWKSSIPSRIVDPGEVVERTTGNNEMEEIHEEKENNLAVKEAIGDKDAEKTDESMENVEENKPAFARKAAMALFRPISESFGDVKSGLKVNFRVKPFISRASLKIRGSFSFGRWSPLTDRSLGTDQSRSVSFGRFWGQRGIPQSDSGKGNETVPSDVNSQSSKVPSSVAMEEATETVIFCSSIIRDLVYNAMLVAEENRRKANSKSGGLGRAIGGKKAFSYELGDNDTGKSKTSKLRKSFWWNKNKDKTS